MSKFLTVCGVCAMAVAFAGCGKTDAPAAAPAAGAGAAAVPASAEEMSWKCPCGKTAKTKKGEAAPVCCTKPMTPA